jgi:muramidase (phage lysozyme)
MNQVPNPSDITAKLATMSNQQLAQFAQMHKNDPYMLPLASAEDARRQAIRQSTMLRGAGAQQPTVADQALNKMAQGAQPQQPMPQAAAAQLPEETGIAPLAAPNIQGMADGGIAGYAGGTPKGTFDPDVYLNNPNVQRYLKYINMYEGSPQPHHMVNYKEAQSLEDHPRTPVRFGKSKNQVSTAAGSYQLLGKTWDEQKNKLGLKDFSLANQQRAVVGLLKDNGILDAVAKGDFEKANAKAKNIWASIPGSTIGKETGQVPKINKEAERLINAKAPEKGFGFSPEFAKMLTGIAPGSDARAGELDMSRAPVTKSGLQTLPNISDRAPAPVPVSAADVASQRGNTLSGKVGVPVTRAPDEPFVSQANQIPGAVEQPARAPEENKLLRAGKDVLGAPEALLSMGTSAFAPFTHLLPRGIAAISGQPISQEEAVNAVTYAPRLDVSKGSLESAGRAFEDLKIPPFMPGVGGPRSQRVGPAMEAEAAAARAAAEAAAGKVENVRLPPTVKSARPAGPSLAAERPDSPTFPLTDSALEGQRLAQAGRERQAVQNLARDTNEAQIAERKAVGAGENAKSAKLLDEMMNARALEDARRNRSIGDLSRASGAANIAKRATEPPGERPYEAFEEGFTAPETNYRKPETFPAPTAEPRADSQQLPIQKKEGFGLSDEDWLNLGLGLLSGGPREGNAIQDLLSKTGKAGISALAARKEREKTAQESEFKKLMGKYYQDIGAAQSRPGETERIVQQIAKDEGVPFSEAFRMFKDMSYGAGSLSPALLLKEYEKNSKDIMMGDMFRSQYPTFEAYMQSRQGAVSGNANPAQIDPNLAAQYKIVGSRPTE